MKEIFIIQQKYFEELKLDFIKQFGTNFISREQVRQLSKILNEMTKKYVKEYLKEREEREKRRYQVK